MQMKLAKKKKLKGKKLNLVWINKPIYINDGLLYKQGVTLFIFKHAVKF